MRHALSALYGFAVLVMVAVLMVFISAFTPASAGRWVFECFSLAACWAVIYLVSGNALPDYEKLAGPSLLLVAVMIGAPIFWWGQTYPSMVASFLSSPGNVFSSRFWDEYESMPLITFGALVFIADWRAKWLDRCYSRLQLVPVGGSHER